MTPKLHERLEMLENPESRVPCVILIDTSSSMHGNPIREVNLGIRKFAEEIQADELTALRADIAIIAFNHEHQVAVNFGEMMDAEQTTLVASGGTKMCQPLHDALDMIEHRKNVYRENGVHYYRPIIMLLTDGQPNDQTNDLKEIATRIKQSEDERKLTFFPIGTENADMKCLSMLSNLEPRKLRGTNFAALFQWLSSSITKISHSQMGENVSLPPTTGWDVY